MAIITKQVKYRGRLIDISDLSKNSHKRVEVMCPRCKKVRSTEYRVVIKAGSYMCHSCTLSSKNRKNLEVGSVYGRWTILKHAKESGFSSCMCECGTIRDVDNYSLKSGSSLGCGCWSAERVLDSRNFLSIGDTYGKLEVISHSEKSGYSICVCECGNKDEFYNYRLISGRTKSCGCLQRKIASKNATLLSKTQKGKYHPNWKGGVSLERDRHMQTREYKDWRSSVFERDKYTCLKCGQVGYQLNAHHIKNYSEYKDIRVDIDNGVTLCETCHSEFHGKYGNKCDDIDFREFISR